MEYKIRDIVNWNENVFKNVRSENWKFLHELEPKLKMKLFLRGLDLPSDILMEKYQNSIGTSRDSLKNWCDFPETIFFVLILRYMKQIINSQKFDVPDLDENEQKALNIFLTQTWNPSVVKSILLTFVCLNFIPESEFFKSSTNSQSSPNLQTVPTPLYPSTDLCSAGSFLYWAVYTGILLNAVSSFPFVPGSLSPVCRKFHLLLSYCFQDKFFDGPLFTKIHYLQKKRKVDFVDGFSGVLATQWQLLCQLYNS